MREIKLYTIIKTYMSYKQSLVREEAMPSIKTASPNTTKTYATIQRRAVKGIRITSIRVPANTKQKQITHRETILTRRSIRGIQRTLIRT